MVVLTLTDSEARLLAHVLKLASEEFSNHGCNDLNVETVLKLPHAEAVGVRQAVTASMVTEGVLDEYIGQPDSVWLQDWQVMRLFSVRGALRTL